MMNGMSKVTKRPHLRSLLVQVLFYFASVSCLSARSSTPGAFGTSTTLRDSSFQGQDFLIVEKQLGYPPTNFVRVSAWTQKTHSPVAIQTYPLQGGARRRQVKAIHGASPTLQSPFPTFFWLTCPDISRCVGELERLGYLQKFEMRLQSDPSLVERLWRCHYQYAQQRWRALEDNDRLMLMETTDPAVMRMRSIMQESGISGSNLTRHDDVMFPAIKCLHAHYAHYRSTQNLDGCESNPVGEMIHEQLQVQFPSLNL